MVKKLKDSKVVQYPNVARKLLHLGYKIIDLKPKKEDYSKTLFVFENTENFEEDFDTLMKRYEEKNKELNA